ncbi:MAG TPA: hypothetical protein P5089_02865 [Candidatus Portnoybacteria bacterium]|nr:hypothetical protein [Candidatus Portnoybacteria bacterium]
MSILELAIKTGEWIKRNQADIAIFTGFILVAIIAFGAGRLSSPEIVKNPVIIDELGVKSGANLLGTVSQSLTAPAGETGVGQASTKGLFVASRGGTKYHWPWCSYGEKIKQANQIWFNSEIEAKAAGYSPCACISSKAPAGYVNP